MTCKFPKLNILSAYPYFKQFKPKEIEYIGQNDINFVLDSGAFTAHQLGKPIDIKDYINFVKNLPFKPNHVVQLDVIGDAEKSYENYLRMLDAGIECLPVFTRGGTIEQLERLYSHSDYVLIGGVAFGKDNDRYVDYIMRYIKERKVHWLGFTSLKYIAKWKPTSVDSSSFLVCPRYGIMTDIYKGCGKIKTITYKEFINNAEKRKEVMEFINRYNLQITYEQALLKENWISNNIIFNVTAYTHVLRAIETEGKWRTKVFHAVSGFSKDIPPLYKAYDNIKKRKEVL